MSEKLSNYYESDPVKVQNILTAVDVKSAFELYSYRVIGPGDMSQRLEEICKRYLEVLSQERQKATLQMEVKLDEA